jgi:hypothetical protein
LSAPEANSSAVEPRREQTIGKQAAAERGRHDHSHRNDRKPI